MRCIPSASGADMKGHLLMRPRLLAVACLATILRSVPVTAGEVAPELRLPPAVTYDGAEGSPGPVVFSHTTHVPLADDHCLVCHPAPFAILQPTRGLTHEVMNAGGKCGMCHDGTKASGVQDACDHCHRMGGEQ
jgi:c(7)-type cytochrome triheme protein